MRSFPDHTDRLRRDRERVTGSRIAVGAPVTERLAITPDYADRFVLETDVTASPREWATAIFVEGVSPGARDFLNKVLLGHRIEPDGAPGSIAGATIADEGDGHILLAMRGPRLTDNLLIECTDGRVSMTTAMEYRSVVGRIIWTVLNHVHRCLAAPTLRSGARILRSRESAGRS